MSELTPRTTGSMTTGTLVSETVVVQAPMSFTGSAKRIWKLTHVGQPNRINAPEQPENQPIKVLMMSIALCLILFAWCLVLGWYMMFGLLLVPYRLIRRGDRNRKRQALQHREMMAMMAQQQRKD